MATAATNPKQQAHELIERISTAQASAVVTLIISMLDPVDRAIAIEPPEMRLRVGDYRVRFHDHGDSILVLAVKHRREVYR